MIIVASWYAVHVARVVVVDSNASSLDMMLRTWDYDQWIRCYSDRTSASWIHGMVRIRSVSSWRAGEIRIDSHRLGPPSFLLLNYYEQLNRIGLSYRAHAAEI